jgi:Arc/MetJ-type ribon-helix-helix transcriptional regulator
VGWDAIENRFSGGSLIAVTVPLDTLERGVLAKQNGHRLPIPNDKESDDIQGISLMSTATAKAKKITVDIPQSLYKEIEEVVQERHITTSVFVREAIERHLKAIKRRKLERELEQGYLANASLGDRIHEEFELVDAEQA